jgi:hypothetical protein
VLPTLKDSDPSAPFEGGTADVALLPLLVVMQVDDFCPFPSALSLASPISRISILS